MTFQSDANLTYVNDQPVPKAGVRALWGLVDSIVSVISIPLTDVGGTANAITANIPAAQLALGVTSGNVSAIRFKAAATNTGAVTLSIGGGAAAQLRDVAGNVPAAGTIVAGRWYDAVKDGTVWRLWPTVAQADLLLGLSTGAFLPVTGVGGTANAITATMPAGVVSAEGVRISLTPTQTNTGNVTLNGAQIQRADGSQIAAGRLVAGQTYLLQRGSTNVWRIVSDTDDAYLLNRANQTGTQPTSTVTGLDERLSALAVSNINLMDGYPVDDVMAVAKDAAQIYIDADDYANGTIASLPTKGYAPQTLTPTGTGADVVKTSAGLVFDAGKYLRWSTVTPLGPFKKALVVLDLTMNAPMTGTVIPLALQVNDVTRRFQTQIGAFTEAGALIYLTGPGNALARSLIYKPIGQRVVLSFYIDFETGAMEQVDPDNYLTPAQAIEPALLLMNELRIGQAARITLHRAAVFTEA